MGETITLALSLVKIGGRSIGIRIAGSGSDGVRFVADQVLVTTSLDSGDSISIPHDIRAALARVAASPSTTEREDASS
jgi:4-hydroxybenzoyl-CoA thioesterase